MSTARLLVGDVRKRLLEIPDDSVDLVFSSPPFLALRSYLPLDHPDKALEMGSEPTPGQFIDALLDVIEDLDRVLAPHGSLVFELGDTYSGSGGSGGDYNEGGLREDAPKFTGSALSYRKSAQRNRDIRSTAWPLEKSLCLIPESFRWALVYGFNPFTGRETPPWRVRNVVRWFRPNPPVGALADKFRPATSDLVVACKSRSRWFDLDAVRVPLADSPGNRYIRRVSERDASVEGKTANNVITKDYDPMASGGAPPLDTLIIPTQPYKGSHYATFPEALVSPFVQSMCPQWVCRECGEPRRRLVDVSYLDSRGKPAEKGEWKSGIGEGKGAHSLKKETRTTTTTTGWTDCGHDAWRTGVVLDPFAGSGTTLAVASGHGRDAIGIDLDARNADLARERVGMFLEVDQEVTDEATA